MAFWVFYLCFYAFICIIECSDKKKLCHLILKSFMCVPIVLAKQELTIYVYLDIYLMII